MDLCRTASSFLNPKNWPFSLDWLPQPAYLVGGIVRDALLERQREYLDLDFVLPQAAVETAATIARHYQAGFVVLDAQRQIARVVFPGATVDFALQDGATLEADLQRRDFTINAIAYDPHQDKLLDPLQGYPDLRAGCIRMVAVENLRSDPLRLLRAYRQGAQLQFHLDPQTEAAIGSLAPLVRSVAAERIQSELNYLLREPIGSPWLEAALAAGLLQDWLPSTRLLTNPQPLQHLDHLAASLTNQWPPLIPWFYQPLALTEKEGYRRSGLALAKLTTLLSEDPQIAEAQWQQLKGSRAEVRALGLLKRLQPQVGSALSIRQQYFLCQEAGALVPVLVLLGFAHATDPAQTLPLQTLLRRFLDPQDRVAHPRPWLTGKDLLRSLALSPGPQIGKLLTELQIAEAEGRIDSREAAIAFATQWLHQEPPEC